MLFDYTVLKWSQLVLKPQIINPNIMKKLKLNLHVQLGLTFWEIILFLGVTT